MAASDSVNQAKVDEKLVEDPPKTTATPKSVQTPATPSLGVVRTERPVEPPHPNRPFERKEDEASIGNPEMIFALKMSGQLGEFYNRNNTTMIPTSITINLTTFRAAAYYVLCSVVKHEIEVNDQLDTNSMLATTVDIVEQLANGIAVMTYLKIRSVNYLDTRVSNRLRRRPKVPAPFEVPLPYALAISQLGQVKISGMPTEVYLTPGPPENADVNYGCLAAHRWSPVAYARAVEHAKKLGLRFATPDLTVKMGSSWWLYRPVEEDDIFSFQCPYPEENFTENTAVLASLFIRNVDGGFYNPFLNVDDLGDANFGTMLRRPPLDVAINTYYAIVEENSLEYKVVN